jgi:hypothetical protein
MSGIGFEEPIKKREYPLLPPSSLNTLHESSHSIKDIGTESVQYLEHFFQIADVSPCNLVELVHLLAKLTDVDLWPSSSAT